MGGGKWGHLPDVPDLLSYTTVGVNKIKNKNDENKTERN